MMTPGAQRLFMATLLFASASDAIAQSFGASPLPGSIFGKDDEPRRDVSGPSLSASEEPVVDLRVEGNKTIPASQILAQLQTRIGRPYDPKIVQKDVKKLASLSWFVDVQPLYQRTPEGHIVVFRVVERPTIRYVEYLGNVRIRDKKLEKETGLKAGGAADPHAVEDGRRKIEDLYRQNGFNLAQVSILEGLKPGDKGIVYIINEGNSEKIWKVSFEGNEFVSDGRLRTQVQSKPGLLRIFKGELDLEVLTADIDKLTSYYRSFGYFQAKVGRIVEYDDEEGGDWVNIRFVIHEGPRYSVRNVSFIGNQLFASDSLALGITLPQGLEFEQAKMNADVNWLKEVYGSRGYVFADVKAEPVFLEEPGQIDLVYHITEGKKWRVGRIFIHIDGDNPHTRIQTALNRLSFQPGEIMDIREVKASERRLQASSLFHVDAARSVYPKITYRIPELENTEFSADGGGESFRGQSPDVVPVPEASAGGDQVYEVRMPVATAPAAEEAIDVHLDFTKPGQPAIQHVAHQAPKTVEQDAVGWSAPAAGAPAGTPSSNPYGNLQVPSQNPYQPQPVAVTTTPYSKAAPENHGMAERMPGFGGTVPRATSPQTAPIGNSGQNAVQPAQFASPLPGPQPQYLPPGPVVTDPSVTPLPGGSTILPGDPWGPPGQPYADPAVDVIVNLEETQTGRLMVGVGVNSDAGVVGQILLDERNFDWRRLPRSWQDFADGTAFRGDGQRFRIEAAPGTRVQRYLISFTQPYLMDTPVSLSLSASYFDRIYRDWDEQRVGGRVGIGYQWTENDLSALLSYRGEDVFISNVSDPGLIDFQEVLGHNALHGFGVTITNDTRDNPFLATTGHYLQLSAEQVLGSFTYPKAEIDARKYFLVNERPDHSGRHVVSVGTRLGFAGNDTPIYDRFFAGGFSTMRGFDFRGASPVVDDVQVGGDFQWLNSVEYLFPITADDMLHGVAFCDFGTTEPNVSINDFRVAPGVGLRITVPAMGPAPIALDFAWPVVRADTDDTQVFSFFIGFMR